MASFFLQSPSNVHFFSRPFLGKRVHYSHGFSSVFFFDTPEVTKIVLPKVLQNFQNIVQNKTDVQNLENILRITPLAILVFFSLGFFSALRLSCENFCIAPRVPLHLFQNFATEWTVKNSKAPFTFFGTVTQFKNLIFFRNFFSVSKGSPFSFSFCNNLEFQKAQKVLLLQF